MIFVFVFLGGVGWLKVSCARTVHGGRGIRTLDLSNAKNIIFMSSQGSSEAVLMRNDFTLILFSEQPDNYDSNEVCLASLTLSGKAGQLNDAPCNCNLTGYISQPGRFYTS